MKHFYYLYIFLLIATIDLNAKEESVFDQYSIAYERYSLANTIENSISLAHASNAIGQTRQAKHLLIEVLDKEPKNSQALKEIATAFFLEKRYPEAGEYLARLLEYYPNSESSQWAQKLAASMHKEDESFSGLFMARMRTGYNSDPAGISTDNSALSNFMAQYNQTDTSVLTTTEKEPKSFYAFDAVGNYIHDLGDRGGLYQTYGFLLSYKDFIGASYGDYATLYGSYGLGHSSSFGQFLVPISLGYYSNQLQYGTTTTPTHFSLFISRPSYSYRLESGDTIALSFTHIQTNSIQDYLRNEYNSTGAIISTYTQKIGTNNNLFELEYGGTFFTNDHYKVTFFTGDANTNSFSGSRFSNHRFGGITLFYNRSFSARINVLSSLTFKEYSFNEAVYMSTVIPYFYNRDDDPNRLLRHDSVSKLKLELQYKHDHNHVSGISYQIMATKTDYPALEPLVHEITYNFYWLP